MRHWRLSPDAFRRLSLVTAVIIFLNIVSGAAVRLTGSGLGCPDWPECSRTHITPASVQFHSAMEFGNRMVVVLLTISAAATALAAWRRQPARKDLTWLSLGLLLGIIAEAVVGGIVVYSKLNPYVVMFHFCVGILLLANAVVLVLRAGHGSGRATAMVNDASVRLAKVLQGVLAVAIVAGTATTGAGPHAGGVGAKRIPVPLDDMARIHSSIVLVLGALTLLLLYTLHRDDAPESVQLRARVVLFVMVGQGLIGYTQFFTKLPPLLVGIHVAGGAALWSVMLWFFHGLFFHQPESEPVVTAAREVLTGADGLTGI